MKTIIFYIMAVLVVSCCRAGIFNDGFVREKKDFYIENYDILRHDLDFEKLPGMKGKSCMRLRYENQQEAMFPLQAIKEGKKYTVNFRSIFKSSNTLENNPSFSQAIRPAWKLVFKGAPMFDISFYDKNKKRLVRYNYTVALPYGKWHRYERKFIAPPKSAFVRFCFAGSIDNSSLYLDDLRFNEIPMKNAAFDFDFDYPKYELSGWAKPNANSGSVEKDGKMYFNTAYGSSTERFSLTGNSIYKFIVEGIAYNNYNVKINFYNEQNKIISSKNIKAINKQENIIKTPPNTKYGDILIYNYLLKKIRFVRSDD